jgi:3'-phosphoadenosine 5'-phosphosulfate (PAPS) 3'-phosphatase
MIASIAGLMQKLDHALLKTLLQQVSREEILPRFHHVRSQQKADGILVTEADIQTQTRLQQALENQWPHWPLLGEEMSEQEQARPGF